MDVRLNALRAWAGAQLGRQDLTIEPASADASFRRYFRVGFADQSLIAMDAPPGKEDSRPFLEVATLLADTGVNVPRIHAVDLHTGFLLLDDLGSTHYLAVLSEENVDALYADALDALVIFQTGIPIEAPLPPYDRDQLLREMELFREWFLRRHLGIALTATQEQKLTETFEALTLAALAQPKVFVHRDYHSRNLMLTSENNPGILDFQDAVIGPVTYDLMSLLRDAYIAWPRERVEAWVLSYLERLRAARRIDIDEEGFLRWFDLMGAQRFLKVIGIFARLNHRDGKPGYLDDIPRVFGYLLEVAQRYPELVELQAVIDQLDLTERVGNR
jgi:aminoglycoside/choline kinase family phosphotransferase